MKIISHRGNLEGPNPNLENNPDHIKSILDKYPLLSVEIDVWLEYNMLFLGHDRPEHKISLSWLMTLPKDRTYYHLKSLRTVEYFNSTGLDKNNNCFFHNDDKVVYTSFGDLWCYPETYLENGITVMWDSSSPPSLVKGICTDYPLKFLNEIDLKAK